MNREYEPLYDISDNSNLAFIPRFSFLLQIVTNREIYQKPHSTWSYYFIAFRIFSFSRFCAVLMWNRLL